MSVRVADRSLSRMEYVHNAQQILFIATERINKYVNKLCEKKRNKYYYKQTQYSIWNSPIYYSQLVYNYCQLANKERDFNKRVAFLSKANQNLALLESTLQTFYNSFKRVIKDKFIILITEKIDYQYKLLKGCMQYARNISCSFS